MTFDEFVASIASAGPPTALSQTLVALWHDAHGDWNAAHEVAQDVPDPDGAWVHAYFIAKRETRATPLTGIGVPASPSPRARSRRSGRRLSAPSCSDIRPIGVKQCALARSLGKNATMPFPDARPLVAFGLAAGLYFLLTVALTWPLLLHPGSRVPNDLGDSLLNMFLLAWNARVLPFTTSGGTCRSSIRFRARWRSRSTCSGCR